MSLLILLTARLSLSGSARRVFPASQPVFSGFLRDFFCQGRALTLSMSDSLELACSLFQGLLATSCTSLEQSALQVGCGVLGDARGRGPIEALYPGPWLHSLQRSCPLGEVGGETVS